MAYLIKPLAVLHSQREQVKHYIYLKLPSTSSSINLPTALPAGPYVLKAPHQTWYNGRLHEWYPDLAHQRSISRRAPLKHLFHQCSYQTTAKPTVRNTTTIHYIVRLENVNCQEWPPVIMPNKDCKHNHWSAQSTTGSSSLLSITVWVALFCTTTATATFA